MSRSVAMRASAARSGPLHGVSRFSSDGNTSHPRHSRGSGNPLALAKARGPSARHVHVIPLTQNLADPLPPLHLGLELRELRTERVARRDHADGPPFFDHRHVTKTVFEHHHQRVMEGLVR